MPHKTIYRTNLVSLDHVQGEVSHGFAMEKHHIDCGFRVAGFEGGAVSQWVNQLSFRLQSEYRIECAGLMASVAPFSYRHAKGLPDSDGVPDAVGIKGRN
jgi:hypothetical protein